MPALENRPELDEDLKLIMQCWTMLHGRRQVGFTANPISFSDIQGGLDFFCVEGEQREDWFELLIALDVEFLRDQARKRPSPQQKRAQQRATIKR